MNNKKARIEGRICKFVQDRGFGLIESKNGKTFLHISAVKSEDQPKLREGVEVSFTIEQGDKRLQAAQVTIIKEPDLIQTPKKTNLVQMHNPYNFVRPLGEAQKESQFQKQSFTGLNKKEGLSGNLKVQININSPLAILGEEKKDPLVEGHKLSDFYQEAGEYRIPASSLKGAVRAMFEAATNSCFSVLTENQENKNIPLFKRGEMGMSAELIPARITKDETGKYYAEIMYGHVKDPKDNPQKVQHAAWIYTYPSRKNTKYKDNSAYGKRFDKQFKQYEHKQKLYAKLEKILYTKDSKRSFEFYSVTDVSETEPNVPGYVPGYYYKSGENSYNKHDERFFYRNEPENSVFEEKKELDDLIVKKYEQLLGNYVEVNSDSDNKIKPKSKPPEHSRHVKQKEKELKDGDLVYVKMSKDYQQVEAMYPVQISRVQYKHSILNLIKEHHEHLLHCNNSEKLCPACRTFGWVSDTVAGEGAALKSRVSFSSGELEDGSLTPNTYILRPLDKPKPTTVPFYLKKPGANRKMGKHDNYNNPENVEIRGRKFYLDHGKQSSKDPTYEKNPEIINKGNLNRSVKAFDEGSFLFNIEFTNLSEAELGALLWAVTLEEGMNQHIGYGKPLGLGSVKMEAASLMIEEGSYRSWDAEEYEERTEEIAQYIEQFKKEMATAYETSFEQLENIADIIAIHTPTLTHPIRYPSEIPFENQFKWFMNNNNKGNGYKQQLPIAAEQNDKNALPGTL